MLAPIYRPLVLLRFDATVAGSFGLSYKGYFSLVLFVSCALAASAVGVVGPIVFVGLIGRLAGGADEVPIGVVTAFVGVPVVLALLRKTL